MERIQTYREERVRKLREQEDVAREEIEHCTFKPKTNEHRDPRAAHKAGPS